MRLKDFAVVISGYTFREAIEADENGNSFVFQAKDVRQANPFYDITVLTKITQNLSSDSNNLKKNDIIQVARGMKTGSFRSTVFVSEEENIIASSSVHIIRLTAKDVLPEYVSYYLNSKLGQDCLSKIISGSYIGAVPRKELENINIPIPSINYQQAIIDLFKNMREQQKIIDRKSAINKNILNSAFRTLVTK